MTTTRTLRSYLAELPEGDGSEAMSPDLTRFSMAGIPTSAEINYLAELVADAAKLSDLAPVAISGDYNALINRPTLFSGAYADLTGKPALFSGNYADLAGKPTLGTASAQNVGYFATAAQGLLASTALQPGAQIPWTNITGKPTFFSGAYADLTGKPTLFSGAYADLTGKPTLGSLAAKNAVAISDIAATGTASATTYLRGDGSWSTPAGGGGGGSGTVESVSLSAPTGFTVSGSPVTVNGTLTFSYTSGYQGYTTTEASKLAGIAAGAEVNVNADWNAASGDAQILNKPTLFSGAYADLSGKPTLGTAAASNTGDFATATQGTKADSALQPAAIGTSVQAYDADLTTWAGITPATGIGAFLATPTSANLRAALTDEVGTGAAYFVGGALGTPASATLTNATGLPIIAGTSGTLTVARGGTGLTAAGTSGNVLVSNGTGFVSQAPTAAPPKAVTSTLSVPFALATTDTWTDTGLTVTITPSSTAVRILLLAALSVGHSSSGEAAFFRLVRGAIPVGIGGTAGSRNLATTSAIIGRSSQAMESASIAYLDAPSAASATTYKVQMRVFIATAYLNRSGDDSDGAPWFRGVSTLTAIEVSA